MQRNQLDVNGITMQWDERGAGHPVVFVHGIPTGPRLWRHVAPYIDDGHVLAWEMVGYGESIPQGAGRDISVRAQAQYLLQWLDALEIQRAVLVGHDLGGGVVQLAAIDRPEMCAAMVLTNSIGYDSWPIPFIKALRLAAPIVTRLPTFVFRELLRFMIRAGHDKPEVAAESFATHWPAYERYGPHALVRQIQALRTEDTDSYAPQLPSLRGIPVRVVWGEADSFQKVEYGQRLADDLGTLIERIGGARHFTPEDHPEVIAAAVKSALRDLDVHQAA